MVDAGLGLTGEHESLGMVDDETLAKTEALVRRARRVWRGRVASGCRTNAKPPATEVPDEGIAVRKDGVRVAPNAEKAPARKVENATTIVELLAIARGDPGRP